MRWESSSKATATVFCLLQKKRKQASRDADSLSLCSLDINVSPLFSLGRASAARSLFFWWCFGLQMMQNCWKSLFMLLLTCWKITSCMNADEFANRSCRLANPMVLLMWTMYFNSLQIAIFHIKWIRRSEFPGWVELPVSQWEQMHFCSSSANVQWNWAGVFDL